jgi:N-acyl-D-aspartate/D-glutamate deacylase
VSATSTQEDAMLTLRGGTLVDGTGAPARRADVRVQGGRIVEVGEVAENDDDEVDCTGLTVAPGFIDNHTHYDAQILWDRDLTPSSWHGVTSVVMGNCGYSVAPVNDDGHETIVLTLENVEGMAADALREGIDWSFETFPEYLDTIGRGGVRLNVGGMIGHTALRYYVMGGEASDRPATSDEITRMQAVVRESMAGGALGFSTSGASVDNGAYGKPVPSRVANRDELLALAGVLAEFDHGIVQLLPHADVELTELADAARSPVTYGAILSGMQPPGVSASEMVDRVIAAGGGRVVPQIACRPVCQQTTMLDPFTLTMFSPAFVEALGVPRAERPAFYSSAEWRERAHAGLRRRERLDSAVIEESNRHQRLVAGPTLAELAVQSGKDVLDVLIDLSLEDDLQTRFKITLFNDDDDVVAGLLNDKRCLLSLSDAGAHQSQICDAVFSTHLLGYWVRERQALPLELAVWRLTAHPADVFGIRDRGRVVPGMWADIVAFDAENVGVRPLERVHDLPAGADRLIGRSTGVEHVWVNGVPIRHDGVDVGGARPGMVLRG